MLSEMYRSLRERQTLFKDNPMLVGFSPDLPEPGSFFTFDDLGVPILLTRDRGFLTAMWPCVERAIDYVLDHANEVLTTRLTRDDVIGWYAGLRPLLQPGTKSGTDSARVSRGWRFAR